MSQKKVDEYKDYKKNRKKVTKKEKVLRRLEYAIAGIVLAVIVAWVGWSVYHQVTKSDSDDTEATTETVSVNFGDVEDYYNNLDLSF